MVRFIAIPVGQGDAFYLETKEASVLVDGGRSITSFAQLFQKYTGKYYVDVLIATHNDADHANGILGFLRAGLECREVWLPGRWAELLPEVLRPREQVVYLLARAVTEIWIDEVDKVNEGSPLEHLAASVVEKIQALEQMPRVEEEATLDESGWSHQVVPLLESAIEEGEWWAWPVLYCDLWLFTNAAQAQLLREALVAAERIRQIALEAYRRGVRVRWFTPDIKRPGGGTRWLIPLSSREMVRVRHVNPQLIDKHPWVFLALLSLTVWNRESMVFWVPPQYAGGGVLFTADSDLKDIHLPPFTGAIVTAPHHGSEANKAVYQKVTTPVIWVRSDGRFRSRPCREYIQAPGRKYCTLCRHPSSNKQPVVLYAISNSWVKDAGVRDCMCR